MTGLEQRGCWQERHAAEASQAEPAGRADARRGTTPLVAGPETGAPAHLDFIPVDLVAPVAAPAERAPTFDVLDAPETVPIPPRVAADVNETWADRTSLFGEEA